jgi:hypothetical protein
MKKDKTPYQKIRKVWEINPKERIKEPKFPKDECEECGLYKSDPEICMYCED